LVSELFDSGTTLLAKAPRVSTFSPKFVSLAEDTDGIRCPRRRRKRLGRAA
jgi:hypothetical protein